MAQLKVTEVSLERQDSKREMTLVMFTFMISQIGKLGIA